MKVIPRFMNRMWQRPALARVSPTDLKLIKKAQEIVLITRNNVWWL